MPKTGETKPKSAAVAAGVAGCIDYENDDYTIVIDPELMIGE